MAGPEPIVSRSQQRPMACMIDRLRAPEPERLPATSPGSSQEADLNRYASEWVAGNEVAIIPLGSVTQHGGHLPIDTDTIIATEFARRLSLRLGAFCLPCLALTPAHEHAPTPGTVNVSATAC